MSEETPDLGSLMRKLKEIEEQMKQQGERGGKNSDAKFMDTLAKGVSLEKLFEGADGRYKIPAYLVKDRIQFDLTLRPGKGCAGTLGGHCPCSGKAAR